MRGGQAGRARERQVAERLRSEGWVVLKGTTFGVCDLAAFRHGDIPMLIEVKSTADGPYKNFSPAEREVLVLEAVRAGARAVLAWWPPRKQMRLIPSSEWPSGERWGLVVEEPGTGLQSVPDFSKDAADG